MVHTTKRVMTNGSELGRAREGTEGHEYQTAKRAIRSAPAHLKEEKRGMARKAFLHISMQRLCNGIRDVRQQGDEGAQGAHKKRKEEERKIEEGRNVTGTRR